jgi:hypothetical protein
MEKTKITEGVSSPAFSFNNPFTFVVVTDGILAGAADGMPFTDTSFDPPFSDIDWAEQQALLSQSIAEKLLRYAYLRREQLAAAQSVSPDLKEGEGGGK